MSGDSSTLMHVGFVGAPFGVRGWVKLRSHTNPPERLLEHRSLLVGREGARVEYRIEERGRSGGVPTAKLSGIEDRDQAAALRGAQIHVPRADLPQRDAKDFYRADLIGCEVVNLDGVGLGVVRHFVETAAQALMVVRGEREYWVPAVPQHVRRVDLAARRVVVDWDAAAD
jgi:16S rRNA processing protein RimM